MISYLENNVSIGDYWVQSSPGHAVKVFCDMERVCGCDDGRGKGGRVDESGRYQHD